MIALKSIVAPISPPTSSTRAPRPADEASKTFRADRLAILLGLRTGLRRSEFLALQRRDVDLSKKQIHIRRRISRNRVGPVKSKTSRRTVPMTSGLQDALQEHLCRLDELAMKRGQRPTETDPLFPAERDRSSGTGSMGEGKFSLPFREYLREAKARGRHQPVRQLRHTYASELLPAGVPVYSVIRWLG